MREKKKKLITATETLRFEKSLELASKQLKETGNRAQENNAQQKAEKPYNGIMERNGNSGNKVNNVDGNTNGDPVGHQVEPLLNGPEVQLATPVDSAVATEQYVQELIEQKATIQGSNVMTNGHRSPSEGQGHGQDVTDSKPPSGAAQKSASQTSPQKSSIPKSGALKAPGSPKKSSESTRICGVVKYRKYNGAQKEAESQESGQESQEEDKNGLESHRLSTGGSKKVPPPPPPRKSSRQSGAMSPPPVDISGSISPVRETSTMIGPSNSPAAPANIVATSTPKEKPDGSPKRRALSKFQQDLLQGMAANMNRPDLQEQNLDHREVIHREPGSITKDSDTESTESIDSQEGVRHRNSKAVKISSFHNRQGGLAPPQENDNGNSSGGEAPPIPPSPRSVSPNPRATSPNPQGGKRVPPPPPVRKTSALSRQQAVIPETSKSAHLQEQYQKLKALQREHAQKSTSSSGSHTYVNIQQLRQEQAQLQMKNNAMQNFVSVQGKPAQPLTNGDVNKQGVMSSFQAMSGATVTTTTTTSPAQKNNANQLHLQRPIQTKTVIKKNEKETEIY